MSVKLSTSHEGEQIILETGNVREYKALLPVDPQWLHHSRCMIALQKLWSSILKCKTCYMKNGTFKGNKKNAIKEKSEVKQGRRC